MSCFPTYLLAYKQPLACSRSTPRPDTAAALLLWDQGNPSGPTLLSRKFKIDSLS
jgi:hypothetical protein